MEVPPAPTPEELAALEKKIALAARIEEIRDLYGDIKELHGFGKKGGWFEREQKNELIPDWLSVQKTRLSHRSINTVRQVSDTEEQVVDYFSIDPDLKINLRRHTIEHINSVGVFLNFIGVRIPGKKNENRLRYIPNAEAGKGRLVFTSFDNRNSHLIPQIKTVYVDGKLTQIALDPPKRKLKRGEWMYESVSFPRVDFEVDSSFPLKTEPVLVRPTFHHPWPGVRIDNLLVTSGRHADSIKIGMDANFVEIEGRNAWTEETLHVKVHKQIDPLAILEHMQSDDWINFGLYPHPLYERK